MSTSRPTDTAQPDLLAIVSFTGDSGVADYAVSLVRELARIAPACLVTSNRLAPECERLGFAVVKIFRRTRWYPVDVVRFVAWCLRRRPRAVGMQSVLKLPLVDGLVVSLLRTAGIRCVLTVHDVLPHYPRPWSFREYGWFYRRFDGLVVHSAAARDKVSLMAPDVPLLQMPHGVYDMFRHDAPTRAQARERIGLGATTTAGRFVVLFFGHLEPRKGLGAFLAVAERFRQRSEFHFVLAGALNRSHCPVALQAALERARGSPNVLVHEGRVPFERVQDYFIAADLVALPYLEGSTSGVLKLAIAFGVPVVATGVGDLAEEMPAHGGLLIDGDGELEDRLFAAVVDARRLHDRLRQGMRAAAGRSAWDAIAARYHRFLTMASARAG
jgi:glycosyltransferase involved in cell wall biosynthesis